MLHNEVIRNLITQIYLQRPGIKFTETQLQEILFKLKMELLERDPNDYIATALPFYWYYDGPYCECIAQEVGSMLNAGELEHIQHNGPLNHAGSLLGLGIGATVGKPKKTPSNGLKPVQFPSDMETNNWLKDSGRCEKPTVGMASDSLRWAIGMAAGTPTERAQGLESGTPRMERARVASDMPLYTRDTKIRAYNERNTKDAEFYFNLGRKVGQTSGNVAQTSEKVAQRGRRVAQAVEPMEASDYYKERLNSLLNTRYRLNYTPWLIDSRSDSNIVDDYAILILQNAMDEINVHVSEPFDEEIFNRYAPYEFITLFNRSFLSAVEGIVGMMEVKVSKLDIVLLSGIMRKCEAKLPHDPLFDEFDSIFPYFVTISNRVLTYYDRGGKGAGSLMELYDASKKVCMTFARGVRILHHDPYYDNRVEDWKSQYDDSVEELDRGIGEYDDTIFSKVGEKGLYKAKSPEEREILESIIRGYFS